MSVRRRHLVVRPSAPDGGTDRRTRWRLADDRMMVPEPSLERQLPSSVTDDRSEVLLNNGLRLPSIGFGVFQSSPDDTREAVATALDLGYRHVDTAAMYGNERQVGEAVRDSGLPRDEIVIESKV